MAESLLKIIGRVQGVAYRAHARREAQSLNLVGYAKNLSDGSVEILLQGDRGNIEEFIKWAYQGPSSAEVSHIETKWNENSLITFDSFKIY